MSRKRKEKELSPEEKKELGDLFREFFKVLKERIEEEDKNA